MSWDAVRFCKDFSIPYVLPGQSTKVTRGRIGIKCPNPACQSKDKLDFGSFNISGAYYSCWTCGGHGLHKVVKWLLGIRNEEAYNLIQMYYGTSMLSSKLNYKKKNTGGASKVILPGTDLRKSHKQYLQGRNFDPDMLISKYKLTGVGRVAEKSVDRQYLNRIIIPIIDHNNKVVSFQGRDITGTQKIRYKGADLEECVMNYKHTLYGLPYANHKQCGIVEGVVDQWAMGDGFLCTFGISVTAYQIKLMSYFDRIFILYDPEKNAQDSAKNIAGKLAALNKEVEVIEYDSTDDPGELPEDDRRYLRRELGFV